MRLSYVLIFALPTGSRTLQVRSLSRHSPYTSKSKPWRFRASSTRTGFDLFSMALIQQFALPTGSRTFQVRSLSRHSPYTSSLPSVQLRACSHCPYGILSVQGSLLTRKKTACLFGQAEESTAQAVISLFIPEHVQTHLDPDIHLVRP